MVLGDSEYEKGLNIKLNMMSQKYVGCVWLMNIRIILSCFIISSIFLCSCFTRKHYSFPINEIEFANRADVQIEGSRIVIDEMGLDEVIASDSFLILLSANPAGYVSVLDINTYNTVAYLCRKGRARNEFMNSVTATKQIYYRNNELILPIVDNMQIVKEVNITESVKRGNTVVEKTDECISIIDGYDIFLENDIEKRFEFRFCANDPVLENAYTLPEYYQISSPEKKEKIKVFPKMMDFQDPQRAAAFYSGCLFKHPGRNLIVQPFQYMDYILFFDLDNGNNFAIHQSGSLSFDDLIPAKQGKTIFHFCDCTVSDDFFIVLYKAGLYSRSFEDYSRANPEIIVFDWDGNYINSAKLGNEVHSITYDSNRKILYGIDRRYDSLYSFDLSNIVSDRNE